MSDPHHVGHALATLPPAMLRLEGRQQSTVPGRSHWESTDTLPVYMSSEPSAPSYFDTVVRRHRRHMLFDRLSGLSAPIFHPTHIIVGPNGELQQRNVRLAVGWILLCFVFLFGVVAAMVYGLTRVSESG